MQARLLYRDGLMLVIDKPAGVAVHRGPKGGANLEDDFDALRFGLPRKPALAHRLDRDTAGCLVLGRHHKALEKLGLLFKQGKIGKTYWAIVVGGPAEAEGLIDKPLARLDAARGWWMKVDASGLPAKTGWRVCGRGQWRGGQKDPGKRARRHDVLRVTQAVLCRTVNSQERTVCRNWSLVGRTRTGDGERLNLRGE